MTSPTTLHFRAENFEAVATRVVVGAEERRIMADRSEHCSAWDAYIVQVGGTPAHSVRLGFEEAQLLTAAGWRHLVGIIDTTDGKSLSDERALALTISLLYSVPGVEVVT